MKKGSEPVGEPAAGPDHPDPEAETRTTVIRHMSDYRSTVPMAADTTMQLYLDPVRAGEVPGDKPGPDDFLTREMGAAAVSEDAHTQMLASADAVTVQVDALAATTGSGHAGGPRYDGIVSGSILAQRYALIAKVAIGGMGIVFKAIDKQREQAGARNAWVAIKAVTVDENDSSNREVGLHREYARLLELVHPNIVRVFDFNQHEDQYFIVMEWLEGETLTSLLQRPEYDRPHASEALAIVLDAARGLAFAHGQGTVHADINPSNILVTDDGQVKLLDFGIFRDATETTESAPGQIWATPGYASCEVLEGQKPQPADDVYSMACTAYYLLTGRRPYGGRDALQAEADGLEPAEIPWLSERQWQVLRDSLAFRQAARPRDATQFLDALTPAPDPVHFDISHDRTAREEPEEPPATDLEPRQHADLETRQHADADPGLLVRSRDTVDADGFSLRRVLTRRRRNSNLDPNARWTDVAAGSHAPGRRFFRYGPVEGIAWLAAIAVALFLAIRFDPPEVDRSARSADSLASAVAPAYETDVSLPVAEYFDAFRGRAAELGKRAFDGGLVVASRVGDFFESTGERVETALENARARASAERAASDAANGSETSPAPGVAMLIPEASASVATDEPAATIVAEPAAGESSSLNEPELAAIPDPAPAPVEVTPVDPGAGTATLDAALPPPELMRYVAPGYPRAAERRGIDGWVRVGFVIDAAGQPRDIVVRDAEPAGVFESATLAAVAEWRYVPTGTDRGHEARVRFQVPR